MQETQVRSLDQEDPLKRGMATHSSSLARRIAWSRSPLVLFLCPLSPPPVPLPPSCHLPLCLHPLDPEWFLACVSLLLALLSESRLLIVRCVYPIAHSITYL